MLVATLSEVGIDSHIHASFAVVEDERLSNFDIITLHCVRWTCRQTPAWRDEWSFELSSAARDGLLGHLAAGKGILAMHEHFIDCIRTGETPCSDIRDVIHTSRLVERLMGL